MAGLDFSDRAADPFVDPRRALDSVLGADSYTITSGRRTEADQARLRRQGYKPARNSDHLRGEAFDVVARDGRSPAELAGALASAGVGGFIYPESDHLHWSYARGHPERTAAARPAPAPDFSSRAAPATASTDPFQNAASLAPALDFSDRGKAPDVLTAHLPDFAERFGVRVQDTFNRWTLLGAGANALAREAAGFFSGPEMKEDVRRLQREDASRADLLPAPSGAADWAADIGGGLAGGLVTPESAIALPERALAITGRPIVSSALRYGAGNALANVASDPVVQGLNISGGVQDRFDPMRTVSGTALSAAIGAPIGGLAGAGGKALAKARVGREAANLGEEAAGGLDFSARAVHAQAPTIPEPDMGAVRRTPGGLEIDIDRSTDPEHLRWLEQQGRPLTEAERAILHPEPSQVGSGAAANDAIAVEPPFGGAAVARPAETAPQPGARDQMDEALDLMRAGRRVRADQGPSLVQFITRNGGLIDDGGELAHMDANLGRVGQHRIARTNGGLSFEDMAQRAYDAGYFPEVPPPRMDGADNMTAVDGDMLVGAIREELFGKPRFAGEPDPRKADLAARMDDLDEMLTHMGLDLATMSNAEVKRAISDFLAAPEPVSAYAMRPARLGSDKPDYRRSARLAAKAERPSLSPETRERVADLFARERVRLANGEAEQSLIPGVDPLTEAKRELARLQTTREARRGNEPPPSGGLFDERGMTPATSDLFGGRLEMRGRSSAPVVRRNAMMLPEERVNALARGFAPAPATGRPNALSRPASGPKLSPARNALAPPERLPAIDLSAFGDPLDRAAGRASGGMRAAPRPGAVAAKDHAAHLEHTISGLATRLKQSLGLTARQGRLTLKGGAIGEYDPATGVIRTKVVQEMDVLSHEGGHALEHKNLPALDAAIAAHATELRKMAYPGARKGTERQEGFAEFFRWYLTNPDHARKQAPGFYGDFERALAKDAPAVARDLHDIQSAYQAILRAPSVAVVQSVIVNQVRPTLGRRLQADRRELGVAQTRHKWSNELYRRFVDDLHPINMAVGQLLQTFAANAGKKLDLKVAANPYALARMSRGAYASAHMDVLHGVVPYKGTEPEGAGLADALQTAFGKEWKEERFTAFGSYLAARRLVHEWDRYAAGELERPPDKLSREAWAQAIKDFDAANPSWKEAAGQVYEWTKNLWKKERDAGFITEAQYQRGLDEHPDYVPIMRDMNDRARGGRPATTGPNKYAGGVDPFLGSQRDIINPIQSLMQRAYTLATLRARNDVIGALVDLGEQVGPGSGAIIERIPAQEANRMNLNLSDALARAAKDAGLAERDASMLIQSMEAMVGEGREVGLYRMGDVLESGEPIIYLWRDGKRSAHRLPDGEFGKVMFDSFAGMTKQAQNLVVQLAAAPTQALRFGITAHPEFFFANYVRDQVATWILSDVGFKPGVTGAVGIAAELKQGDLARLYNSVGGIVGGANVASLDKARVDQSIKALNKQGYRVHRFASLQGAIKASEISETGTRLGLFKLATQQAKRRGLSDYEAAVEAAFTARDVLDWDRHGASMLSAIRTVTFLNAALQGLDKARRVMGAEGNLRRALIPWAKDKNGLPLTATEQRQLVHSRKAWAKVSALGVLGMGLAAIYADDPEYQEMSDYLRATHWTFKANGNWIVVPKPFELAAMSNIMERGWEGVVEKDPTAWGRLVKGLGEIMVPPHEMPAIAVPFQIAANKDHNGHAIVPPYLKGQVEPEQQFNAYTSKFSRALSGAIGTVTDAVGRRHSISPAVLDHVIVGFGGSWGRSALAAVDVGADPKGVLATDATDAFVSRRFVRDVTRGSNSEAQFWDLTAVNGGQWSRAEGSIRQLMKEGKDAAVIDRLRKAEPAERSFVLASMFVKGKMKQLHPLLRAQVAVKTISEVRRELSAGTLKGPRGELIAMPPGQRKDADRALSYLEMTEARNALIAADVKGWSQKERIPYHEAAARVRAANPALMAALSARMEKDVLRLPVATQLWQAHRARFETEAMFPALPRLLKAKRMEAKRR